MNLSIGILSSLEHFYAVAYLAFVELDVSLSFLGLHSMAITMKTTLIRYIAC